jgi:hypothetical protein
VLVDAAPAEERRDEVAAAAAARGRASAMEERSAAAIATTQCGSIGSGGFRERDVGIDEEAWMIGFSERTGRGAGSAGPVW